VMPLLFSFCNLFLGVLCFGKGCRILHFSLLFAVNYVRNNELVRLLDQAGYSARSCHVGHCHIFHHFPNDSNIYRRATEIIVHKIDRYLDDHLQNICICYHYGILHSSGARTNLNHSILFLETCFPFLIHCWPIRAPDVSHFKIQCLPPLFLS